MRIKAALKIVLVFFGVVVVIAGIFGYKTFLAPVTPDRESQIKIRRGMGLAQIADSLVARGVLQSSKSFSTAVMLSRRAAQLKAGKYIIPPRSSNFDLIKLFVSGKAARQRLTIPEGVAAETIAGLLHRELEIDSTAVMGLVRTSRPSPKCPWA